MLEAGKPEMAVIGAMLCKRCQTLCGVLRHVQPLTKYLSERFISSTPGMFSK